MKDDFRQWEERTLEILKQVRKEYSIQMVKKLKLDHLNKIFDRVIPFLESEKEKAAFQILFDNCLELVFLEPNPGNRKNLRKTINKLDWWVLVNYKIVRRGHYLGIFMSLGVSLGSGMGILLDNLALGMALGFLYGLGLGGALDLYAQKQNRVL